MTIEANEIANYGLGTFAIAGGGFYILRWVIRTFHIDKLAIKENHAEINVIDRLESEITRLETIIHKQQGEIASMMSNQRNLERMLSNQRAILLTIDMIIENMCTCDSKSKAKLAELIAELMQLDTSEAKT